MKTVNLSLTKNELDVLFMALSEIKINATHTVLTNENEAKRKIAQIRANNVSELMFKMIPKFNKFDS